MLLVGSLTFERQLAMLMLILLKCSYPFHIANSMFRQLSFRPPLNHFLLFCDFPFSLCGFVFISWPEYDDSMFHVKHQEFLTTIFRAIRGVFQLDLVAHTCDLTASEPMTGGSQV